MILLKNEPNTKLNHIFKSVFVCEKRHKNESKNVSKNILFCSIFVTFWYFDP